VTTSFGAEGSRNFTPLRRNRRDDQPPGHILVRFSGTGHLEVDAAVVILLRRGA
jgi:hypothetical protein